MRVSAHAATEGKFFASGRMLHVQRTLVAIQLNGPWASGTARQLDFRDVRDSLQGTEIIKPRTDVSNSQSIGKVSCKILLSFVSMERLGYAIT